jgi:hypothetical protein
MLNLRSKEMSTFRQAASAPAEQELTRAVRRVYDTYGSDLGSFFRDVQEKVKGAEQRPQDPDPPSEPSDDSTPA